MGSDIRKILCPTDWSEPSLVALQSAVRLARRENALLVLLHVVPALMCVPGLSRAAPLSQAIQHEAFQKLVALIAQYVPDDVRVQPVVRVGEEADEIHLAALGCDVVVMSTHGRTGWEEAWAFGSVAQTVLRETACPIFVIGPQQNGSASKTARDGRESSSDFPFKQVLWPTDWSAPAEVALDEALVLCARHGAELLMLHVLEAPEDDSKDAREAQAHREFDVLCERKPEVGDARRLLAHGLAAPEINRIALAEGADVIVMSSHGRTGWNQNDLGSTTRKVMRLVPCPVLLVPVSVPVAA